MLLIICGFFVHACLTAGSTGAKKAPKQAKADKPKKAETETAEDGDSKRKGDRAGEKLLPKPHHKAKLPAHKDYPGWEQDFGFAWEKEKKEVPKSKVCGGLCHVNSCAFGSVIRQAAHACLSPIHT